MTYISTASLMGSMRPSIMSTQTQLSNMQTELASGIYADVGLQLGGGSGQFVSLEQQQARLSAFTSSNAMASTRLSATGSALSGLQTTATAFLSDLTTAAGTGGLTSSVQPNAQANLSALISSLNTTIAGQSVFGGINSSVSPMTTYTDAPPSANAQAIQTAFQAAFGTSPSAGASSITAAQMSSFLSGSYASLFSPPSYASTWSSASDTTIATEISPGQTITTSVTANDASFRSLAQAYAMVSEFTGSNSTLNASAQQAVIQSATTLVNSALTGLINLQSNVGIAQNTITSANDTLTAQATLLSATSNGMVEVDATSLNTKLTALQTQIQASYEVTNALQKLSLVNYFTP